MAEQPTSSTAAASVLSTDRSGRRILAPSSRLEAFSDGVFGITMTLVLWWNLVLLLTVSFTPFPNALVADYLHAGLLSAPARTATAVYGLVFTASTIPWIFTWSHVLRNPSLMEPGWGRDYPRRERRRAGFGVVVYSCCVAVAAFVPLIAVLMFIGLAAFYGVTSDGLRSVPFRQND